ncbi:MAG: hypothetical protein KAI66_21315, partial [Lentisphaeria bacterium]|nr:hypothetical protein [Lentisphaeria bacterium]
MNWLEAFMKKELWLMAGLLSVVIVQTACQAQEFKPDWGEMWTPALPSQERHPHLFYDETDRKQMLDRLRAEPYARWWKGLQRRGIRSTPAVKWWLL